MPFSFRRLTKLQWFAVFILGLTGGATIAVSQRGWFLDTINKPKVFAANAVLPSPPSQVSAPSPAKLVKSVRLWPQFQKALSALGDRFVIPGKERLVLAGTLKRNSNAAGAIPVRMFVEYPEKFRLEEQVGNKVRVTTFDGEKKDGVKRSDGNVVDERDEDEIESLIFDGVEHLFSGQMEGLAKREIGAYLQPNLTTFPNYVGPLFNIYEITDRITLKSTERSQRKLYYFNVKTSLPEIIQYQVERGRGTMMAEARFADWQSFNGQLIPKSFVRLEHGNEVLRLSINAVVIQPAANDGIFTIPGK